MRSTILTSLLCIGIVALTACGAATLPVTEVAAPREQVKAAEALEGDKIPEVSLHLKYARDQIAASDSYLKAGDEEAAKRALLAAGADAELALELAKKYQAANEAAEAREKVDTLNQRANSN